MLADAKLTCYPRLLASCEEATGGERLIQASMLQISEALRDALAHHVAESSSCRCDTARYRVIIHTHTITAIDSPSLAMCFMLIFWLGLAINHVSTEEPQQVTGCDVIFLEDHTSGKKGTKLLPSQTSTIIGP